MRTVKQAWSRSPDGTLLPGTVTNTLEPLQAVTIDSIRQSAELIEQLYLAANTPIRRQSDLSRLIANAKSVAAVSPNGPIPIGYDQMLLGALDLDRIASAILPLADVPNRAKYLSKIASGQLDFFKRIPSHAKDTFWEVEAWSILQKKTGSANLCEPADIDVRLDGNIVGIACKKIYSENHVQSVLSKAVSQTKSSSQFGIVAFNIDDLTPPDSTLLARDPENAQNLVAEFNQDFIARHERFLKAYLESGRLVAALVSTSVIVRFENASPLRNYVRQWNIWSFPILSPEHEPVLQRFRDLITD
jgi:hypothetical protein